MGNIVGIYTLKQRNKHLFLEYDGESYMVDTGSPFSSTSVMNFLSIDDYLKDQIDPRARMAIDRVLEKVPLRCDGLVGMDVFLNRNVLIDLPNERIVISYDRLTRDSVVIPVEMRIWRPLISTRVDEREIKMVVDTGAFITYLPDGFFEGEQSIGEKMDFYPYYGDFNVELYRKTIRIGDISISVDAGTLPQKLARRLSLEMGDVGILSNHLFQNYPVEFCLTSEKKINICI